MSYNIIVDGGSSVRLPTAGKYCVRDIVVTANGSGGGELTPVATSLIRRGIGYIDTGIDAANSNLTIQVQYEFETVPTGYWYLIRAYVNEDTNSTRILYNGTSNTYCCLNSVPRSASLSATQKRYEGVVYTDILKPESNNSFSYTTNGVKTTKTRTSGDELVGENILLFSDSTSKDSTVVKLYYLKIYDGNTLVRDFAPFVMQNGECGLYDNVTKRFFGNDGSGTFEAETINGGGAEPIPTQEKTIDITENGTVEVAPDEGYALSKVTANVNVPIPNGYIKPSGTLDITENGEHDVVEYAKVSVNVPSEAPNIQPLEITENGTYTAPNGVDGYSPIIVNVESGGGGAEDNLDDFLVNTLTDIESDVTKIVSYGSYGRTALKTVNLPKCTDIGSYAFRGCTGITNVNAPLATSIGTYGFYGCSKLADVNMSKVTSIGTYAFYKCDLRSVNFPLATGIAQNAFFQNENLERADFGVANKINQASFGNCSSLVTLILRRTGSICTLGVATNGFSGTPIANGTGYVYVPKALIEDYKVATNWVNYASQFRAIEDYPEITGG